MIKKLLIVPVIAVMAFMSGCSNLGQNAQDILNSPAVQALIAQAEQFAIQFAENWIASHLGAHKGAFRMSDAGPMSLKAQLQVQYHLSDKMAEDIALAAFAKAQRKEVTVQK